jgi:hypothetical protein
LVGRGIPSIIHQGDRQRADHLAGAVAALILGAVSLYRQEYALTAAAAAAFALFPAISDRGYGKVPQGYLLLGTYMIPALIPLGWGEAHELVNLSTRTEALIYWVGALLSSAAFWIALREDDCPRVRASRARFDLALAAVFFWVIALSGGLPF